MVTNNIFPELKVNSRINKWLNGKGSTVFLNLKHLGDTASSDWQFKFQSKTQISKFWNGDIVSQTFSNGQYEYTINFPNNLILDPGEKDYFKFNIKDTSPQITHVNSRIKPWRSGEGSTVYLDLKNLGDTPLADWQVTFQSPTKIGKFSNGEIVSQTFKNGQFEYTINFPTNQILEPGEKDYFKFNIRDIAPQINHMFIHGQAVTPITTVDVDVNLELWGGYGASINVDLTNQGDRTFENWQLEFTSNSQMIPGDFWWDAEIVSETVHNGQYQYLFEFSSNQDLEPGEHHSFGFNTLEPSPLISNIAINGQPLVIDDGDTSSGDGTGSGDDTGSGGDTGSGDGNGTGSGDSNGSGKFRYGEALQKSFLFYEANRSGPLPDDNRLEWRSDSTVNDGSTVGRDLTGGYFDAGDHIKFGHPMAATVNMLAWGGVEYKEAYQRAGQFDELLDAVRWGTDYFLKAHETSNGKTSRFWVQVGESQYDHSVWTSPEKIESRTTRNAFAIDPSNPGSDVAASTSTALAAASILFRGIDDAYADELLNNAKQLYEFADTYQGKYSDSVSAANPMYRSWNGYGDDLTAGAAWLYKATGEKSYLDKAENYFKSKVGGLSEGTWSWDELAHSAAVILAQESNDQFFKNQVEDWLDEWINGSGSIQYSPGGFAWIKQWASIPLTAATAFIAELYHDTVNQDSRYSKFANEQIDYILGDNPRNYSYMIGFGENYPQRPHHRGSAPNLADQPTAVQENILYGAIVGGPGAPDDYSHNDRRDDWVTNEVGTSYNAPVTSALIQQYDNLGGDPLSESELDQLIGIDANGVGF